MNSGIYFSDLRRILEPPFTVVGNQCGKCQREITEKMKVILHWKISKLILPILTSTYFGVRVSVAWPESFVCTKGLIMSLVFILDSDDKWIFW